MRGGPSRCGSDQRLPPASCFDVGSASSVEATTLMKTLSEPTISEPSSSFFVLTTKPAVGRTTFLPFGTSPFASIWRMYL